MWLIVVWVGWIESVLGSGLGWGCRKRIGLLGVLNAPGESMSNMTKR